MMITEPICITILSLVIATKVRKVVSLIKPLITKTSHRFPKCRNPLTTAIRSLLWSIIPPRSSLLIAISLTLSPMKSHPTVQPSNPYYPSALSFLTNCDSRSNKNPTYVKPFAMITFLALFKRIFPWTITFHFLAISLVNLFAIRILYFLLGSCRPISRTPLTL